MTFADVIYQWFYLRLYQLLEQKIVQVCESAVQIFFRFIPSGTTISAFPTNASTVEQESWTENMLKLSEKIH
jgi:hypothetical protein